jgi:nucleotide-binding universal stress UspA family protein
MQAVPAVVVGVDGSAVGARAVRFAAEEAARRGCPLKVIHVRDAASTSAAVSALLSTATGIARGYLDDRSIVAVELSGNPAAALVAESGSAELLVVGRGQMDRIGDVLGSVALLVVGHAACPVITVAMTDPAAAHPDAAHAGVVAGIKHVDQAAAILETAFAQAELRGCGLEVVHAWRHPQPEHHGEMLFPVYDPVLHTEEQADRLAAAVRAYADRYPGVVVTIAAPHAGALDALAVAGDAAALVVVGAPHRGPVAGLVLGSVGQSLLRHLTCPVVFIPSPSPPSRPDSGRIR